MATTPQADARPLRERGAWWRDKVIWLLIVSVALMVFGSLLAQRVTSDNDQTSVSEVTIFGEGGQQVSAYLYTPKSASAATPAPAIAMWHGLNNQKDYMTNTALELARRGFVVLSADQTGHGWSSGVNQSAGCGGPATLAYLRGLPVVDTDRVGLVGMSQGGFCAATAAAMAMPDDYSSIFYMESEPNAPGQMDVEPFMGLRNIAYNIGGWTELGSMIAVDRGGNAVTSPVLLPLFGTDGPIEPGKVYGSIADGTARVLYTPYENHSLSTDSPEAIGHAIDWMQQTLTDGKGLDSGNQVWPIKFTGTAAALFGAFLFLFAAGTLYLRTRTFATLVRPVPEYRGLTGIGWWIGALLTTAIGPLLYLWVWKGMFFTPWLPVNSLWPQTFTNIYMVWAVIVGVIAWVLILINHFAITRRSGGTLASYGMAEPGGRIAWGSIGKSVALAALILLPIYLIVVFVHGVWQLDFRAWIVALQPMSLQRWMSFFAYLVPFAFYFVAQGISFNGFLRWRRGTAPLWQEMLVNAVVMTLGAAVWLLINYIPLWTGGASPFATDPLSSTAAGLGGIYYMPMLIIWPLAACLWTYFFRKTGRTWLGSILVTGLMVWTLVAAGDFAVWQVIG